MDSKSAVNDLAGWSEAIRRKTVWLGRPSTIFLIYIHIYNKLLKPWYCMLMFDREYSLWKRHKISRHKMTGKKTSLQKKKKKQGKRGEGVIQKRQRGDKNVSIYYSENVKTNGKIKVLWGVKISTNVRDDTKEQKWIAINTFKKWHYHQCSNIKGFNNIL